MSVRGNLTDLSPVDVFQLMARRYSTGILRFSKPPHQIDVWFKDSMVLRVESKNRPMRERLGTRLVRAGLLTQEKLDSALAAHRAMARPIGTVLLLRTGLGADVLEKVLRLQAFETLFGVLTWTSGTYELIEELPGRSDGASDLDIRSEAVIMEAMRQQDGWAAVREHVPSPGSTFEMLKPLPEDMGGSSDDDFEAAFLSDTETSSEEKPGPNEAAVWPLVELGLTAQEIADRSLLGEFDAMEALARLVRLGYLGIQSEDVEF